jgi:RNA polymerase sigma factor (sigma-70 family)
MRPVDPATLAGLFARHGRALTLYARAVLGPADAAAADDVLQEVFVSLLAQCGRPGGLSLDDDPAPLLHRCIRNECLDVRRGAARRRRREKQAAVDQAAWFDPRPDDLIDARSAERALAELPETPRQIVVLRLWSRLSLSAIGEVVGLPTSTVHDQFRAAIARLRQRMSAEPENAHVRP